MNVEEERNIEDCIVKELIIGLEFEKAIFGTKFNIIIL